ncbi:hypothetical protein FMUND_7570 [Fusarium mundagurra]|uniref:Uncharacterized protein n=1 Tax=Fusarium mundagurra TaxID=1567541 RepID=A0A8H6DF45_9HYPO|nr:hypothetical protein FMUND_7570 [Fusarium mundagurra]
MFESDQNQNVPHSGQDPAQVRPWMSPRDPSSVSPGILMLLNNQEINSRVTPNVKRSRHILENTNKFREVAEAQLCDFWDFSTLDEISGRLLSLNNEQVVDLYITLGKRLKDEKSEGKKTALPSHQEKVVQTRTASFRTNIQGLDDGPSAEVDTPPREKRKAPQTPGHRRLMRGRNVVHDSEEEEEEEEESGITDEGFL